MSYFNFYAVQVKRLQKLVPDKKIEYAGREMEYVMIKVDGVIKGLFSNDLRKMKNLELIARGL